MVPVGDRNKRREVFLQEGFSDEVIMGARRATKHIALRFFFIRELVTEGKISIHYVPTEDNLADIGTKHFNKHRFKHLIDLIYNFDVNEFTAGEYKGK